MEWVMVFMMTTLLNGGEVVYHEHQDISLVKCELAREAAISFNNRAFWPWETEHRNWTVLVECEQHPGDKEA